MKNILILLHVILFASCGSAQYSVSNSKAVKLFEEGQKAPSLSIDPQTHLPNYKGGLVSLKKAIEKEPNFWEAHLLAAEFSEYIHDYEGAIYHYEQTLRIHPNHTATGSTYFYLANSQYTVGDYESAIRNIDIYVRNKNANPEMVNQAYTIRASCEFAANSMKNPQDFNPINVGAGINTKDPEYFPTITVDGKTILFTRRIQDNRTTAGMQEDFYVSTLSDDYIWQTAIPMPPNVNTVNNEGAPTIAADGRSLIFVACPDETGKNYGENRYGKGSCDLFYTKKLGSRWMDPINLMGNVNSFLWESQPSLSADGKTLYFASKGHNSMGGYDIFKEMKIRRVFALTTHAAHWFLEQGFAAFGVDFGLAAVAVLTYRGFAFWLPTIPGAIAYFQLRKTVAKWRRVPVLH